MIPPLQIATKYCRRKWSVVPVPFRSKNPGFADWQQLRLTEAELPNRFNGNPQNVGVLLGDPSDGLVDIDLDCPEAIALAHLYLPPTECIFGRRSKPNSHYIYRCLPLNEKTLRLQDVKNAFIDGKMRKVTLVEFRSTGAQTIFPGSVHENGESIEFAVDSEPSQIHGCVLLMAVQHLAGAVLLARHWPGIGSRHDAANALAGGLARAGWGVNEVVELVGAVARAAGDEEYQQRRAAAALTCQKVANGENVTGWPSFIKTLDPQYGKSVVNRACEWLEISQQMNWFEEGANSGDAKTSFVAAKTTPQNAKTPGVDSVSEVLAFGIQSAPFEPFPLDALPDPMLDFVTAVSDTTGTDPAFAAVAALVVAAGCIGNRAVICLKYGWSEPAILWAAIAGKSGSIKSPVLKAVTQPLIVQFREAQKIYAEHKKQFVIEEEHHKLKLSIWKQAQKTNPDDSAPPQPPPPPTIVRVLVGDVTLEKLAGLSNENPLGLILSRDELACWVGGFDRYASGKGGDQPAWLSIYDAHALVVDRKADGTIFVERPSVSVLGTIQPRTLKRCFGQSQRESGLLARLIVVHPPCKPPKWSDAEISPEIAQNWGSLTNGLLKMSPFQASDASYEPHRVVLSKGAKAAFIAWHDAHVGEMEHIQDDDLLAHYSKLKGIVARIALVFACVESIGDGKPPYEVSRQAMNRAVRVGKWLKLEAARVYAELGDDEDESEDRRLINLIRRRGGQITVRGLSRASKAYRNPSVAHDALIGLVGLGVARAINPRPSKLGGRPTQTFVLIDLASAAAANTSEQISDAKMPKAKTQFTHAKTGVLAFSPSEIPSTSGVLTSAQQGEDGEVTP